MQRIRRGLYLLESALANCYLIEGTRGLTLFDTGQPSSAPGLIEEIERNGFSIRDIEAIVLSHSHFDHAGGARGLLERHRVKVFAHPADSPSVKGQDQPPRNLGMRLLRFLIGLRYPYRPLEVVVPIDEGEALRHLPQWQVLRLPGHTAGSIGLYQPGEKALLCGDALNNRGRRLAIPGDAHCQDPVAARESVRKMGALDLEVLGCGHGPVLLSRAGLKVHDLLSPLI
ncbi:MAG: MBL fold metallo-hydrolase [Elusimicrobia bacterium]|nr:MBL fold metallo-hydrolase [Elusimicrobiota bacterium]